jgi:phosphoserine aminotransferase
MSRVYNFNAGPGMLADDVLKRAQEEMLDWHGKGESIMEIGHRSPEFIMVAEQAEADIRELMSIPNNYQVIFVPGGATAHFSMVPLNLLGDKKVADYVDTGIWSKKAIVEAKRYGDINIAAEVKKVNGLTEIPTQDSWSLNQNAAYLHYTPNETIEGIEFNWVPAANDVPLVADMSSMILSRPVDVKKFGIIYAGAQKNLGQAGITVGIIHEDLLTEPHPYTPTLYNYKVQAENKSFYNTPPTYSWYITGLVLEWMKKKGGVNYFSELNQRKAKKLYSAIDSHKEFYINTVHPNSRSQMNVPFDLPTPELSQLFLTEAAKERLVNLKGHRLAGGVRASIYNAMPEEGVDLLVEFMKAFVKKYG